MKTYEMVALAEQDGKTYYVDNIAYTTGKGFHDKLNENKEWSINAFPSLYNFILGDGWKETEEPTVALTLAEIEAELGYKFELIVEKQPLIEVIPESEWGDDVGSLCDECNIICSTDCVDCSCPYATYKRRNK